MKIIILLSFLFFNVLFTQAGYFDSFTQINKDQILTPKSAAIIAGGLGIYGFGYCVKDLWTVGNALYQGDEAIARLKIYQLLQIESHDTLNPQRLMLYPENSESIPNVGMSKKLFQMNLSLSRLELGDHHTKLVEINMIKDENQKNFLIDNYWENHFVPARQRAIADAKTEFKWRAAKDISMMAAIGAVGYAGYTLINK